MRNVLNTCFTKLVAVLPDEVLDRLHHAIEVERYRRVLNGRPSIEPPPPSAPHGGEAMAAEACAEVEEPP